MDIASPSLPYSERVGKSISSRWDQEKAIVMIPVSDQTNYMQNEPTVSKMAQQVKVLAVKSNDLSSTSGIQVVEERTDPCKLTSDYHTCVLA